MAFPGQVDKIVMNLEQAKCLTSQVRNDVFWAFINREPQSVAQVAKALRKSAQTVHYHVKELLRVGLLLAVDTRQSRSRTEVLYVHAALTTVDQGSKGTPEHNRMRERSFRFTAKSLIKETELFYNLLESDPAVGRYRMLRHHSVLMAPEQVAELRARVQQALKEVLANPPGEEQGRVHVMFYASPTRGQAREWLEERGMSLPDDPDSEDETT